MKYKKASRSEGKKEGLGGENVHHWHADRPGPDETEYLRLKVMIYLQSTTKEQGALRVIPGSHRMPFHELLWPLQAHHFKDGTIGDSFAVKGEEIPACVLEIAPGDVVFFTTAYFMRPTANFPDAAPSPSNMRPVQIRTPSCARCTSTRRMRSMSIGFF